MDGDTHEAWAVLRRLMGALERMSEPEPAEPARQAYVDAREEAARALLQKRALSGRPWRLDGASGSFYEQWAALRERDRIAPPLDAAEP